MKVRHASRHRIELHGGKAALEHGFGAAHEILRLTHLVAPAVRIDADSRADRTAEEVIDRLSGGLADDVPKGLLDPRRGAEQFQRAAALGVIVERDLQDMPDLKRIAPHHIAAEFLDLRRDGAVAIVLAIGLAPADQPGIRGDAHEHEILTPAGMNGQAFHAGDLHDAPLDSHVPMVGGMDQRCGAA